MGYIKYLKQNWQESQTKTEEYSQRLLKWRRDPVTMRIARPTRPDRARSLGYKAKQGIFVVRQRVSRGGRQRPQIRAGRRPRHFSRRLDLRISYQAVAEQRVAKKFTNCEVLNSYFVAKDGTAYYYEVIMVERANTRVLQDKNLKWIKNKHGRAARGMTSAGKRSRGILTKKGKGAEKLRPSLAAHKHRAK